MVFMYICMQLKIFFFLDLNLSSPGHSHVGALIASEEQKEADA